MECISGDELNKNGSVTPSFEPDRADLAIALFAALGMPLLLRYVYDLTGALLPLFVYYVVFCWGIVRWRRGRLDYRAERLTTRSQLRGLFTRLFFVLLSLQVVLVVASWVTLIRFFPVDTFGWVTTLAIWAPINAFAEQLIWLYVFDAYALCFKSGRGRTAMIGIGTLLYLTLIGLIHAVFWGEFLLGSAYVFPWTETFFLIQFIIPIGYVFLYRQTRSMWPIAIIHLLLDFTGVLFSGYSILPYLWVLGSGT